MSKKERAKASAREARQAQWLADILTLGNQLRSLDRKEIAQETVRIMSNSLGFEQVALYLVDNSSPAQAKIVAQTGPELQVGPPPPSFGAPVGMQCASECVRTPDGDQIYVPLMGDEGLLGYVTLGRPDDNLQPMREMLQVIDIMARQAAMALQNASLYDSIDRALDERLAELTILQEIDHQINAKLDLEHVMETTLDWAMHATSALAGAIALLEDAEAPAVAQRASGPMPMQRRTMDCVRIPNSGKGQQVLRVIAHRGYSTEMAKYWHIPWPTDEGLAGQVVQTGEMAVIDDVPHETVYVHQTVSPRSHLATPIKRDDTVVGVITLEAAVPNGFTADHMAFLMRLADHAAIAIENAQLYEQTNRRMAELESLQKISLDLTSSLHLEAVLDSIVAHSRALTGADHVALYLVDKLRPHDGHAKKLRYGTGLSARGKEERPPVPIDQDQITAAVAREGKARVIHNARGQPLLSDATRKVSAIASIPVRKSNRILGVFDISFQEPHTFADDELRVLYLLADQAAIAIENAQLYADAQRAKDAKTEFVSAASHELRVPMTSIQGYARLITLEESGPTTEQQRAFLDIIQKNVRRMNALIDGLVDLSDIESGHALPRPISAEGSIEPRSHADAASDNGHDAAPDHGLGCPADLSVSIDRALPIVRRKFREHDHPITVDIPEGLPAVHGSVDRIAQVWVNLLGAAHRYTLNDGPIKVWARRIGMRPQQDRRESQADQDEWILCAVEHPGIGFTPEERERIFEPFYHVRTHSDAPCHVVTYDHETGLELAIARSIVEVYGGHIWVESQEGKGNTFYFSMPTRS